MKKLITGQIYQNRCVRTRNVTGKCVRSQEQIEMKSYKAARITIILHKKRKKVFIKDVHQTLGNVALSRNSRLKEWSKKEDK